MPTFDEALVNLPRIQVKADGMSSEIVKTKDV
jgi:hypothetical protein